MNAAERTFREEGPAVLATLIRHVGDISLAEDALQDAFAAAVATWPRDGVPANPGAWITTTARRRAIDRLRRARAVADRVDRLRVLVERGFLAVARQGGQRPGDPRLFSFADRADAMGAGFAPNTNKTPFPSSPASTAQGAPWRKAA